MIKVIGVRFRKAGKVYYFDPAQMEIKMGDHVIVETARGIEFGEVVLGVREVDEKKVIQPLKSVIRMATKNDEELERKNKEKILPDNYYLMRLIWRKLLTLTDYTLIINYYKIKIPKAVTKRVVSEKAHSESETVKVRRLFAKRKSLPSRACKR